MERPAYSPFDWIAEALTILGVFGGISYVLFQYAALPDWIPLHFSSGGSPDRLGAKSELFIIMIIVLVICLTNGLTARFLNLLDAYGVKIQPGRKPLNLRQFTATRGFLLWLNAELAWLFAFIFHGTIQVGLGRCTVISEPVILGFLVLMGVTFAAYLIMMITASLPGHRPGQP